MRYLSFFVSLPLLCAPVPVPGTAVVLDPPPGMAPAARFAGFESKAEPASLMVVELAQPVANITAGFADPKRLAAQKMTLDATEKVKIAPGDALLFNFTQQVSSTEYKKLILAFGDDKKTVLVTGSYELKSAANWDKPLRAALMSVNIAAQQASAAGFKVVPKGPYKVGRAMPGSLALTPNGDFPLKDRRGPVFLASHSTTPVPIETPLPDFLQEKALALPGVQELKTIESKAITLDGLAGQELIGVANEDKPESAVFIHAIVLRDGSTGYYMLMGLAPNDVAAANSPHFRAMADSFSRK